MSLSIYRQRPVQTCLLISPSKVLAVSKISRHLVTTSGVSTSMKLGGANTKGKKALENALRIDERETKGRIVPEDKVDTNGKATEGNEKVQPSKKGNGKERKDGFDFEGRAGKGGKDAKQKGTNVKGYS